APLGSILIWSQLLRGEVPDAGTLGRALGMIERSTRALARLIDDLLDVSRIVAGTLQVDKAPVELRPVLEAAVAAERPAAEARKIELDLRGAADPPRGVGEGQ